jgi:hypothetical protein
LFDDVFQNSKKTNEELMDVGGLFQERFFLKHFEKKSLGSQNYKRMPENYILSYKKGASIFL